MAFDDDLTHLRNYYHGRLSSPAQAILDERFEDALASHQADRGAAQMRPPSDEGKDLASPHPFFPAPAPEVRMADGGVIERLAAPLVKRISRLGEMRSNLTSSGGEDLAKRFDQASDLTNLNRYSDKALRNVFTEPVSANGELPLLMAMKPGDFEKYSLPLYDKGNYQGLMPWEHLSGYTGKPHSTAGLVGDYLNKLYGVGLTSGFDHVPFLMGGTGATSGHLTLPQIVGHEGRHRMRALDVGKPDDHALVQMRPRVSTENWLNSLPEDRAVWPQPLEEGLPDRLPVALPEHFAEGGEIDSGRFTPDAETQAMRKSMRRFTNDLAHRQQREREGNYDLAEQEWENFRRDHYNPLMYGMNAADRAMKWGTEHPQDVWDAVNPDPKLREQYGASGAVLDALSIASLGLQGKAAKGMQWGIPLATHGLGAVADTAKSALGFAEGGSFLTKLASRIKGGSAPLKELEDIAQQYADKRGVQYPIGSYPEYDVDHAKRVAEAFELMRHNPTDPRVKHSYEALVDETMKQYGDAEKLGLKFKAIKPGDNIADAYGNAYPNIAEHGRMSFFPTDQGFGSEDMPNHPLLRKVGRVGDVQDATANDAFRVVHDLYGHFAPGNPFFDNAGEDRAFLNHARMFSKDALPALASETRGQNSWVTWGPHGEYNRAQWPDNVDKIKYAPQKAGILPAWAYDDAEKFAGGGEVGSRIGDLAKWIEKKYGAAQGRRFEQAGDLTNLENYSTSGLKHVFDPQNAGLYTTMKPTDFEKFAAELGPDYQKKSPYGRGQGKFDNYDDYIDYLSLNAQHGGFETVPLLGMARPGMPDDFSRLRDMKRLPMIDAHEGRHRMRALDAMGEKSGLVHLLPQNEGEMRGGPDEAIDRLMSTYLPQGQGQLFRPQLQATPRPPSPMTPTFKEGGDVLSKAVAALAKKTRTLLAADEEATTLNRGAKPASPYISPTVDPKLQTVDDPRRMMYPLIYAHPRDLTKMAEDSLVPDMGKDSPLFKAFGHTRQSLDELSQSERAFDIPRPDTADYAPFMPPQGGQGSKVSDQVLTRRNQQRILDMLAEGRKNPDLRQMRSWYEMSPMYDRMEQLGQTERDKLNLNARMGVMSPQASPDIEIPRGFMANYLAKQGRLEDFVKYGGLKMSDKAGMGLPEDLMWDFGHAMHGTHVPNMWEYENTGRLFPSEGSHKVNTYVEASSPRLPYYQRPVADSHFTRSLAYPDVRTGRTTGVLRGQLTNSEYADAYPWWNEKIAGQLDERPRDAQALSWGLFGPATGVRKIGPPKLEMIANHMDAVAKARGLPLEEARDQLLRGEIGGFARGGNVGDDYLGYHVQNYAGGGSVADDYLGYAVQNYRRGGYFGDK